MLLSSVEITTYNVFRLQFMKSSAINMKFTHHLHGCWISLVDFSSITSMIYQHIFMSFWGFFFS